MKYLCVVLLVVLSLQLVASVEIKSAKRHLDIRTQLGKETVTLVFSNSGPEVHTVQVAFHADFLSYVYVSRNDKELETTWVTTVEKDDAVYVPALRVFVLPSSVLLSNITGRAIVGPP